MNASYEFAAREAYTSRPCRVHLDEDAVVLTACEDEAVVLRRLAFSQLIAATLSLGARTEYTLELRDTFGGGMTAVVENPTDQMIARDLLDRIIAYALETKTTPLQLIASGDAMKFAGREAPDRAVHPGLGL